MKHIRKTTFEIKVGIQSLVKSHIIQLTTDPRLISLFSVYLLSSVSGTIPDTDEQYYYLFLLLFL